MRAEDAIQRAVFQHIATRGAPGVFAFHPANGGFRRPIEAKILKGLGVKSGVPDIVAVMHGQTFALELKTDKGELSESQSTAISEMRAAGAIAEVAYGLDDAIHWLEIWGILRGEVQKAAVTQREAKIYLHAMDVGESFFTTNNINNVRSLVSYFGRKHGKKFTTLTVGGGVRVWRVE